MSARSLPPLFVECFHPSFPEPVRDVVDPRDSVSVEPGRWQCQVSAPNGVHATLQINAKNGLISCREVADLLRRRSKVDDLWVEPSKARASQLSDDDVLLGAWSGGKQLEPAEWKIVTLDGDGRHRRISITTTNSKAVDHIQLAIEGGTSMVMRYPDRGQLVFQTDRAPDAPIRAMVVGDDPTVSAYWGFTRNAVVRGAYELGKRLVERSFGDPLGIDELIVAAHWLATSGIDEAELHDRITTALSEVEQTSDVRIMRWILRARHGRGEANTVVLEEFVEVLGVIRDERPLYTETFRLFIHHLTSAATLLRSHSEDAYKQASPGLRWVWSLASAMTWDTECTGYRALSPNSPDPNALTNQIGERAKKKSAEWRVLP